jgi:hypothetical protein
MRAYDYYLMGVDNGYGQQTVSPYKQGTVQMSISSISQSVADDIRYSDSKYIGLTFDRNINDTYVIQYEQELLKVQYVNKDGRYTQVFMGSYG